MIIYKGQNNKIGLTLKEKQTLTLSDFVIKFTNDITGRTNTCALTDISSYPTRVNVFYVEEGTNDPINAKVILNEEGQWTYEVHELPQSSPKILDLTQSVAILETGILFVKDTGEVNNTFHTDETKNNGVFEG